MLCVGCVLADPPEHAEAEQTPPILFANQAVPSVYEVLNVSQNDRITVNVPLRSEDVGEGLLAELYVDYSITGSQVLQKAIVVGPGTFEDRQRAVGTYWDVPSINGCHQLTLAVTHNSNLETRRLDDIATVTWWVNVSDTEDGSTKMKDCQKNLGATN
jgi:hypothetical protein